MNSITRTTVRSSSVSVIGGAIAGPAAALRLATLGHEVTVYEQRPEQTLFSAGILGITPGNWTWLRDASVDVDRYALDGRDFTDVNMMIQTVSPFRYMTWTGLHRALVEAGKAAGVRYVFEQRITPGDLTGEPMVIEATGVAGAAARKLPHKYSGYTIYRGLSRRFIGASFVTYHETDRQYFTAGDTPDGAFWAYFVRRPVEPMSLRTHEVNGPPAEYLGLPPQFRPVVAETAMVAASPLSDWHVPARMLAPGRRYMTIGDVNGPVRPVTTSGANLAVMEGFSVDTLMVTPAYRAQTAERIMLRRREYDLQLGQLLEGPEIGGPMEDAMFSEHHAALFPGRFA
jgi:hypothetical protein